MSTIIAYRCERVPGPRGVRSSESPSAREIAVAVREKGDLAIGSGAFCPCVHDENVVDAGHRDLVHTLRLELIEVVEKTWQMVLVAHRCKSPGYAEKDHFMAFNNLIGGPQLRAIRHMTVNVPSGIGSPLRIVIVAPCYHGRRIVACRGRYRAVNASWYAKTQSGFRFFRLWFDRERGPGVGLHMLQGTEAASRSTANS
jgi:hypothetical protein